MGSLLGSGAGSGVGVGVSFVVGSRPMMPSGFDEGTGSGWSVGVGSGAGVGLGSSSVFVGSGNNFEVRVSTIPETIGTSTPSSDEVGSGAGLGSFDGVGAGVGAGVSTGESEGVFVGTSRPGFELAFTGVSGAGEFPTGVFASFDVGSGATTELLVFFPTSTPTFTVSVSTPTDACMTPGTLAFTSNCANATPDTKKVVKRAN